MVQILWPVVMLLLAGFLGGFLASAFGLDNPWFWITSVASCLLLGWSAAHPWKGNR